MVHFVDEKSGHYLRMGMLSTSQNQTAGRCGLCSRPWTLKEDFNIIIRDPRATASLMTALEMRLLFCSLTKGPPPFGHDGVCLSSQLGS